MGPRGGSGLLLPPAVSTAFPCGAVVVGVVIVTDLGVSQQGCGLGEGGRNLQALVCHCVSVWRCLNTRDCGVLLPAVEVTVVVNT